MVGYALIEMGGRQHRVSVGEKLTVDLIAGKKVGDDIEIGRVLMIGGESYKVGKPTVPGAIVLASVSSMGDDGHGVKGDKVKVYKKKRRKGFEKLIGHRQRYTEILIKDIKG
jgi:large subunit ribosomal protein L21